MFGFDFEPGPTWWAADFHPTHNLSFFAQAKPSKPNNVVAGWLAL